MMPSYLAAAAPVWPPDSGTSSASCPALSSGSRSPASPHVHGRVKAAPPPNMGQRLQTRTFTLGWFFALSSKDIGFVLLAQLLAPHVVSLQLVLHDAHAQSADFIVTHHTVELGETVGDEEKAPCGRCSGGSGNFSSWRNWITVAQLVIRSSLLNQVTTPLHENVL